MITKVMSTTIYHSFCKRVDYAFKGVHFHVEQRKIVY